MHLVWNLNSLNDIFSVLPAPALIVLCSICRLQIHSLIEQAPSPHRRCWIMLKGSAPNYPKCRGESDRRLDKYQTDPSSAPTNATTSNPLGRFQDGRIWMCGCMCLWLLLFHFVDVWLCCWQTSVAHASHAALEWSSGGGVLAEVPALIWFPCEAATGRCNHKPMKHSIS